MLADQVRSFPFKNQIKILNKARDNLEESGISPGKVPVKILVPLLDSGSSEEEESKIKRRANLLANAANPKYWPFYPKHTTKKTDLRPEFTQ